MKIDDLTFATANDFSQQSTRRLRARAAFATGLAAIALLGGSAAAQASTTPSAHVAKVKTVASAKPSIGSARVVTCNGAQGFFVDEHHGTPLFGYVPSNGNLYFHPSGIATNFCPAPLFSGFNLIGYQFYATDTSVCLALDASAHSIHLGSATACSNLASYTVWQLKTTSDSSYYLYQSNYAPTQCIYDNTESPATYATCNSSNQFEWLSLP